MKLSTLIQTTTALLGLPFALLGLAHSAGAVTFDHKELEPGKVIAVAVPLPQGDRYNLLILEQLANTRPCWQEQSGAPGGVDPLLLQFDFTDICGRSTDSNGYSIRLAGEDKGLDYRLSVARRNNHLVLLGVPSRNAGAVPIEIAHTETLTSGFLKLNLNPGWRFTKRVYQGKTLGHIYLTRDAMPSGADAIAIGGETEPRRSIFPSSQLSPKPTLRPLNRASAYNSTKAFPITAPVEIPVPDPLGPSTQQTSAVFPIPSAPTSGSAYNNNASILPVPAVNIPMGNAGNEPDLITANTPNLNLNVMVPGASGGSGFPVTMVNPNAYRYHVYVNPTDWRQRNAVKALVPDAFRSFYQGHTVLQVGAFNDRGKADEVIALLSRNGITSILADQ